MDRATTMVWTDGHGSFQARCAECDWRGRWHGGGTLKLREAKAADDARAHGAAHVEDIGAQHVEEVQ